MTDRRDREKSEDQDRMLFEMRELQKTIKNLSDEAHPTSTTSYYLIKCRLQEIGLILKTIEQREHRPNACSHLSCYLYSAARAAAMISRSANMISDLAAVELVAMDDPSVDKLPDTN